MAKLKLSPPTFRQPKRIIHARGALRTIASLEDLDKTAFFISGSPQVHTLLKEMLAHRSLSLGMLHSIFKGPGEPTRAIVDRGAQFLSERQYARIVAIGGGSVLDWCRLAWAEQNGLLPRNLKSPLTLLDEGESRPQFYLVPTTCATGAEAASVAVLTETNGAKVPVISDLFLADCVILDGRFLESCSPTLLADSLADLLSHAIESFVSLVSSSFADATALAALQIALEQEATLHVQDRSQRLMEAAFLAGLAASNCSVGVVHAFAHAIARLGIPHGHANALALIPGVRLNRDVPRMAELAVRCGVGDVNALIENLDSTLRAATAPADNDLAERLANTRLRNEILDAVAADACLRTNPKRLTREGLDGFLDDVVRRMRVS